VFDDVTLDGTTMEIAVESDVEVESRAEAAQGDLGAGSLAPVGVARGAKGAGSRGTGGFSGAPKNRHGWAVWHGGNYRSWRNDHDDDVRMYDARIATLAVGYIGTDQEYEQGPPGPGPGDVSWDREWDNPDRGSTYTADIAEITNGSSPREGWYRVGTELVSRDGDIDFDWQSVDFEIDNDASWELDKAWYVKPRV